MTNLLLLGTRRYSSWSLRAWLAVQLAGLDVAEEVIPLKGGGMTTELHLRSPNRCVPFLRYEGMEVWESLAICLFCARIQPGLLPEASEAFARAISMSTQMHSGFTALRRAFPMNCGRIFPSKRIEDADVKRDLDDLCRLLEDTMRFYSGGGAFLFGKNLTVADAMFAPVMSRLATYQISISSALLGYRDAVLNHPLLLRWYALAAEEPTSWRLDRWESPD